LEPGTKLLAHGPAAGVGPLVAAYGAGGAQIINTSTPTIVDILSFPSGWAASWVCGPSGAETLVAYPPSGRIAVFFVAGSSGFRARTADLPGDFRSVAWSCADVPGPGSDSTLVVFAGYYANGTLVRVQLAVSHTRVDTDQGGGVMSVMVKRETAQATFSHLTSPAIAIALGIFALMAGAFGPAALAGLTDVSQSDKRGTTMGLYSVVISSSMIVGPVTTGYLVDNYGGFGVMVFLVASASAMGLLMALRAWDVRRAGGEHKLHPVPREQLAGPPSPGDIASPPAADSDLAALALPPQAVDPPPEK
jgi:MFS family permease